MAGTIQKNLFLFLIGKMTAVLGSSIYGFAIGLYILAKTGSSLNFAITLLLSALPRILLSPIAGTLSDRWNRKLMIISSDFACAIWLVIVFFIFTFVYPEIWVLYLATAVLSILNTFYSIAVTSAIHNMVGPEYLQKAMSLNQAAASLSAILGPVLGGVFFGLFNITTFMIINIITFTISGLASVFIQYDLFAEKKEKANGNSVLTDLKFGFIYVKNQPFIKNLIMICIWLNFWFAVFPVAIPYLVLTIRKMESIQLGVIEGTFSVGMMVMAIILSTRPEIKRKELSIFGGLIAMSTVLILLGLPNVPGMTHISNTLFFPYLVIMVFLLSTFIMLINMPIMVLLQKSTPDEYRGRVMSLLETGASAMTPLGFIIFGFALEKMPVWILLAVCGLSIIVLILYHIKKKTITPYLREENNPKEVILEV
ncbi:MFS transporter [Bacillus sp. DTU_2020_1000418_1_SI_GHA_SEK_038]|uniref:MFS transporter n=1 Tax=Bacillus sp. DTU_2020_1000418_1_SI_GHA_SEK_038 TaxID=3077585 RepID=UPI0028F0017A|nr:MFS transporter [Bacillus sp. DTU_2020_1000418_1_SI_GHA_SEK_038]WNS76305.1 MFS transporter [Bacillus sp. DTU_2020_1000418_1_SI_GHA_SEK_038]